jgi:hypothetical protein
MVKAATGGDACAAVFSSGAGAHLANARNRSRSF